MNIVRWDPFRSLLHNGPEAARSWVPAVDVFEKGEDLVFRAELPGLAREDIDLGVENGVLTLSGERKREADLADANTYRAERFYGAFRRSFALPDGIDPAGIVASYRDGVLQVTVPRAAEARARKVAIEAA